MSEYRDSIPFAIAKVHEALKDRREGTTPPTGENPSIQLRNTNLACKHTRCFIFDAVTRTVECEDCNRLIDPFDALVTIASGEYRLQKQWDDLQRAQKMANERSQISRHYHNAKQKRCKHRHKYPTCDGGYYCPSCGTVLPPEAIKMPNTGVSA